jgi:O-antigen ligase
VFSQPNELGAFAMLIALTVVGWLIAARSRLDRVIGILAAVVSVATLLLSLSRSAWIGAVAGLVALIVLLPSARRPLLATGGAIVLAGALLGAFAPQQTQVHVVADRLSSLRHATTDNPYDSRPVIYREALREITSHPWLGVGPDNFPIASTTSASGAATVQAEHAHDVMLTVAAEAGLPAALVLLALTASAGTAVLRGLRRARRARDVQTHAVLAALTAALLGLMAEGVTDFTLRNLLVAQAAWAVLALGLAGAAGAADTAVSTWRSRAEPVEIRPSSRSTGLAAPLSSTMP